MIEQTSRAPNTLDSARALLSANRSGVLSTYSAEWPGYPFGSVVPYSLDRNGWPLILISSIAQHTKNIIAHPHVALTLLEKTDGNVQAHGRLTLLADAERGTEDANDGSARYYRLFPESRGYHKTHGFFFYHLKPVRFRYIGGFGHIHWLNPQDLCLANPFTEKDEAGILTHMNQNHTAALRYCAEARLGFSMDEQDPIVITGIDAEGMDLRWKEGLYHIPFPKRISSVEEARKVLIEMSGKT